MQESMVSDCAITALLKMDTVIINTVCFVGKRNNAGISIEVSYVEYEIVFDQH